MRRPGLLLAATAAVVGITALARQQAAQPHPAIERAKATTPFAGVAVLLEMGLKDHDKRDWSGSASVVGAKVLRRDGYRFRAGDALDGDRWTASSHRAQRGAKNNPVVAKMEPIATVGVVLRLDSAPADAELRIELKSGESASVKLGELADGKVASLWKGQAAVRIVSTDHAVASGPTEDDMPSAALGPNGELWVVYVSYALREEARRIEPPALKKAPDSFKAYRSPELRDQVKARVRRGGVWSDEIAVTGPNESVVGTAIAVDPKGNATVAYSALRQGEHRVYLRTLTSGLKVGPEAKASGPGGLWPTLTCDSGGTLWLACQEWRGAGESTVPLWNLDRGLQAPVIRVGEGAKQSHWSPRLCAGPDGRVALAYDVYRDGNYDVGAVLWKDGTAKTLDVASTPKFEARPSATFDPSGALWIAYEEGPARWGKDYGALAPGEGNPLYNERSVRVVRVSPDGNAIETPRAELPTSKYDAPVIPFDAVKTNRYEQHPRHASPAIGVDSRGRVWVASRKNFGSRYTTHPGPYWLTFVRRLEGDRWTEPVELFRSDGLLDHRPTVLPHGDGVVVVHGGDGRQSTPETLDNQIHASHVVGPATAAVAPTLVAHAAKAPDPDVALVRSEAADVARMRAAVASAGGKKYRYFRGEYHRHTEISWDGAPDGSLEDMFRYAIDAVAFDWIGNGDHDNGAGREYSWWLTQKFTDAYHVAGAFTPVFSYERSVSYPHGHRNVMFAERGMLTLPRLAAPEGKKAEGGVHPDDTKMLYRYLHELGGLCAVHTSATGMGTDWRDNDPKVEPIVEIYQGDRMSYEHEGAPRAGYDPAGGKEPANIAGWYPKGFVDRALRQGHKLGFQASSDHWSTHISFFTILAEKNDRYSLLDAVRQRRCYGATDNILVDWRSGDVLMGGDAPWPPRFQAKVVGTAPLAKVEVLRNSVVVATLPTNAAECVVDWTDPSPLRSTNYYYLRVVQKDGELAWASPIWVASP